MTEARTLPILPLRDIVVFPHQPVPLFVGRDKSVRALEEAMKSEAREILLATQKNKDDDDPGAEGIYDVGVIAAILQLLRLPDGTVKVLVEGRGRAGIVRFVDETEWFSGEVALVTEDAAPSAEIEALTRAVAEQFETTRRYPRRRSRPCQALRIPVNWRTASPRI